MDQRIVISNNNSKYNLYNKPETHSSTTKARHERRKAAALEKLSKAHNQKEKAEEENLKQLKLDEIKQAEEKLSELRKRKLPTVGLSIIGLAAKKQRLGELISEPAKTITRKALKPEYKRYKDSIAIENYLKDADARQVIYFKNKNNKEKVEKDDLLSKINEMIIKPKIIPPNTQIFEKVTTANSELTNGSLFGTTSSITIIRTPRLKTIDFSEENEIEISSLDDII